MTKQKEKNRRKRKMANDQFEIFIQMLYDAFEEYKIERGGE
jgi:hypothetical protein